MRFVVLATVVFAAVTPATAAQPTSRTTRTFLANVVPNVDFLDRASRIALTNSRDSRIKAMARQEAYENTLAANALYAWTRASPDPLAPSDRGPILTGRSAATADGTALGVDARSPRGQEDLDLVFGMEGEEFDAAYKERLADALNQVASDYRAYLADGDDTALKAIAANELPKVERAIGNLTKI